VAFYPGGYGHYEKHLELLEEWEGRKILVEFDGAYGNTSVGLNGHQLTMHPHGYTPFHADLTSVARFGKVNRLHVDVNNTAQPNSRWYSGSGLYRHVDLLVSPLLHIAPWGIFAATSRVVDGTAFIACDVTVVNESHEKRDIRLSARIAPDGRPGESAATARKFDRVPAGATQTLRLDLVVPQARLWDLNDPFLYRIDVELTEAGASAGSEPLDTETTTFGIRTVSVDAVKGFRLNGRTIKLKGGCVHHDNGILGAASYHDSEYRKMKLHKDNGYNAIRSAHNPPSRDMLDACDRLGLLVIDEAFDMWRMQKTANDYHLFFEDWWQRDMTAFITRDRNHPCIVFWSTGNEVTERAGLSDGYAIARRLADFVRSLDPTRPVANALCSLFNGLDDEDAVKVREDVAERLASGGGQNMTEGYADQIWGDRTEGFASHLDVVGYNYLENHYESAAVDFPGRVICGTESFPLAIADIWEKVERLSYVIGDFTWTSFDYLGEAGIGKSRFHDGPLPEGPETDMFTSEYPWRTANDADFDLCGFPRPQLHYRRIVWGSTETFLAVQDPARFSLSETVSLWGWPERSDCWNWPGREGGPVRLDVYSAGDEVELLLDGRSLDRRPVGKTRKFVASFETVYAPGMLEAVSYRKGQELSRSHVRTTGSPAGIRLTADRASLSADGQSLAFVTVEVVDAAGARVPDAALLSTAKVTGAVSLAAFGSSNPITTENYTTGRFTSHQGRLQAILRAGFAAGSGELTVEAEGLDSAKIIIPVG
jgi:beta-galactosidase